MRVFEYGYTLRYPTCEIICLGSKWLPIRSTQTITSKETACEPTIVGAVECVDTATDCNGTRRFEPR